MSEASTATKTSVKPGIRGVGRRKEATARVRLISGEQGIVVNGKALEVYFPYKLHQALIQEPMKLVGMDQNFGVTVKVEGGGSSGQAGAVRHGIARALVALNAEFRKTLKAVGFLTRDPRAKERKKPGLRRARRAPQWSKR
jgi:small subunit ribosomal protein S9